MERLFCVFSIVLMLAGCSGVADLDPDPATLNKFGEPFIVMKVPFNPSVVAYVKQAGTAQISGRVAANVKGKVYPGNGAPVYLVPVAEYSQAVMDFLFQGGKIYTHAKHVYNEDRRYKQYMRYAKTDGDGRYVLHGVPAGNYYVYGIVARRDADVYYAVQERVTVENGQAYVVDLDGV